VPSLDLNLQTVSPMFLHGAHNDKDAPPQLREPAFKALFRYWWRAVTAHQNPRDQEGELFGQTDSRSPLLIRIVGNRNNLETLTAYPLPHKRNFSKRAFGTDQEFRLRLTASNLELYQNIANLSFLLGGVGNRSRRGFGSICDTSWQFDDVEAVRKSILNTLNAITEDQYTDNGEAIESKRTTFPDYPTIKKIYWGQLTDNVDNLLTRIGQATHNHDSDDIGSANPRHSSPIHVRIQKVGRNCLPICSLLSSASKRNFSLEKQQAFIDSIIGRGGSDD